MAVMMPREKWTDDRLDELNKRVDDGFARVSADIREFRDEMGQRFEKVDERFEKVDARFEKIDERFEKIDERFVKARGEMDEVSRYLGTKIDRLTYLLLAAALGYIATHGL